uniref:SGNH hydrolase-type esterase domain-containing protein n=1 Tax=Oryzias latipes TaxID=8090 RepID=A0A3P9M2Y1_ORYLA
MATTLSASPPLSCPMCHMFSDDPASFSEDSGRCVKCSLVLDLEARLEQLEARLRTVEAKPASQVVTRSAGRATRANLVSTPAPSQQPGDSQGFAPVGRKHSAKRKNLEHPRLHVSNRFSPLSDTPAEHSTLVIGSSEVRNVELPAATVRCYPGARVGDIEGNLRMLAQSKSRFRRVVIHAGGNDARRRQSEVVKLNVASVCKLAKTMSDTVIFSGPLPNLVNDEMYSRFSSFNRWLSRWCPENGVGFVDNWSAFWGKPGLMRRDGVHPTRDGAALLSRNISASLSLLT